MGTLMMMSGVIAMPLRRVSIWEENRSKRTDKSGNPVELKPLTNGENP